MTDSLQPNESKAAPRPLSATSADTPAVIPRATYRLQFHKDFTFDDAILVIPYLARLGVSHVYCSPIQRARPGSLHGYDVVAHNEVNPELGGQEGYARFCAALSQNGLGQLLDIVPNHMGVGPDNPWWTDVLANGQASPYAEYFDIDWRPLNPELEGKVLLPVLGDHYGEVLARGEFRLAFDAGRGELLLNYFDHAFPVAAASSAPVWALAAKHQPASTHALAVLAEAFGRLPAATAPPEQADAPTQRTVRQSLQRSVAELASQHAVAVAIGQAVNHFNSPAGRGELSQLIDAQAYRLSFWRVAADEINYRRFFDVNELAALRMERSEVFEATQPFALDLAARGTVDGLRIDHPDGLRDPERYFAQLQAGYARRRGLAIPADTGRAAQGGAVRPLYIVAEKIAAVGEEIPESWAIHGTTGYRFANLANGVLVDTTSADRFGAIWREFTGQVASFDELSREGKRGIIRTALSSELNVLSTELVRMARLDPRTRDYTLNAIRRALAETAACMTVYRTYVIDSASEQDARFIHAAIESAKEESDELDLSVFDFVERTLRGKTLEGAPQALQARALRFAIRFQQFSAPVAAKGVEDTAFYRYFPLASLNEVGGEPATFGLTVTAFHEASADRSMRWPHTMLATSTHDNKRSEDVRCRLDALSEMPERWSQALRRWEAMNNAVRAAAQGGARSPSKVDEYLLYQTLLGTLPAGGLDEGSLPSYRERIQQYMQKAIRESKSHTRWTKPNASYEGPLQAFVDLLLGHTEGNAFLAEAQELAEVLALCGALNSVSLMLLKYGSPGVPDLYQGNELIDLSLVDPDNRRAVDFGLRECMLGALIGSGTATSDLLAKPQDGRAKLLTISRLLSLRATDPELFSAGDYVPLSVTGERSDCVVAFARRLQDRCLIIVAGRLFSRLIDVQSGITTSASASASASAEAHHLQWGDTRIVASQWPDGSRFENTLTGNLVEVRNGFLELSSTLGRWPGAALRLMA